MNKYEAKARELRASVEPHYNCAQSVLVPFAEECGLSEEQALAAAANFGGGMKISSVCGAVTGGLMVLGLCGVTDAETIAQYHASFRSNHNFQNECGPLLRENVGADAEKKAPFCLGLVLECVELCASILKEKGKIA